MNAKLFLSWTEEGSEFSLSLEEGQRQNSGALSAGLSFSQDKSSGAYVFTVYLFANRPVVLKELYADILFPFSSSDYFLSNGFQSWSETREYARHESMESLRPFLRDFTGRSGDFSFVQYDRRPGYFHSHLFTRIRQGENPSWYFASLGEEAGYTLFRSLPEEGFIRAEKDIRGQKISGEIRPLRVMQFQGTEEAFSIAWRKALGLATPLLPNTAGWTSWYQYYTKIDEAILLRNLKGIREHAQGRMKYFQIDDGWQQAVGDWMKVDAKFPRGMKFLADEIRAAGLKPGIWWAPFICERDSEIFREHPDWLVTADGEHRIAGGYNPGWSGKYFILNIYQNPVREYLKRCAATLIEEWGFELIKADFLFASAFWPRQEKSRGAIMQESMDFLREICGDATLLGCGVPLGSALGKVDYCRIGPDVGLNWDMKSLAALNVKERISTRNALRNTILRKVMDGVGFRNDPDVFILREKNHHLTEKEQESLWLVNMLFGSLLFCSDEIALYPAELLNRIAAPNSPGSPALLSLKYFEGQRFGIRYRIGEEEKEIELDFS